MPVKYVKKVRKVKNAKHFEKYGILPASLGISQMNYVDKLIDLLKPCNRRADLREIVEETVIMFVEQSRGKTKDQIRTMYESILTQISTEEKQKDSNKAYAFDLDADLLEVLQGE